MSNKEKNKESYCVGTYKDLNGNKFGPEEIEYLLVGVKKTEKQVRDYLGPMVDNPGVMVYHLEMLLAKEPVFMVKNEKPKTPFTERELMNIYTETNGREISKRDIVKLINRARTDELSAREFIGEHADKPGAFWAVVSMLAEVNDHYEMEKRHDVIDTPIILMG